MKMTQIMNSLKKISKIVLLYSTILHSLLFLLALESLIEINNVYAIIALFIEVILITTCYEIFKNDNLENYVPKWFK
jgi:heme O synthase-like polyprenyltransferase